MSRQRTKHTDERREQILAAAKSLFIRHGYAKTSVDDISSAIGMTKSSLYYYFKNKEELFVQTFEQEWKRNLEQFIEASRRKKKPNEQIVAYVQASLRHYEEVVVDNNISVKRVIEHRNIVGAFLADFHSERISYFASCLDAGIDAGIFKSGINSQQIADLILKVKYSMQFDMLNGIKEQHPKLEDFRQMENEIVQAIELLLAGLRPD